MGARLREFVAREADRRERKLQWKLAEATCLVELLMIECSHSVQPGLRSEREAQEFTDNLITWLDWLDLNP